MSQWTYSNEDSTVIHREIGGFYESRLASSIELAEGETVLPYAPDPAALASQARDKRNLLLTESDWTQGADVPQSLKDVWAPYRQALRDVPQQTDFPTTIVWPTKP